LRSPIARSLALAALAALLVLPAVADGASRFWIRGAGFGHGVGMSQYGAQGYALHGFEYDAILAHYYSGTKLGRLASSRRAQVLLASGGGLRASHVSSADGRRLSSTATYRVQASGGSVAVYSAKGRRVASLGTSGTLRGPGDWTRLGGNAYRGGMRFDARGGGVRAVNVLSLDDYVRGVIAGEMPSSWKSEALKVQAVAARTYAVAAGGSGILYPDTRSQVYSGLRAETASTNAAVAATRGQVVTYAGRPAVTYYFSTSGGRTEDLEDSFLGASPQPWLKSVRDPYDSISPLHRWTLKMTMATAARRLSGLVRGRFRGIKVLRRGASPRIVSAAVVGSAGSTRVTGPTLRARFGAYDSWMRFTSITSGKTKTKAKTQPPEPAPAGDPSGGASPGGTSARSAAFARVATLTGTVFAAPPGARVTVQREVDGGWRRVLAIPLSRRGRFAWSTRSAGRYRAVYRSLPGPAQTLAP
jgi:stage II sporulation protein D